MWLNNSHFGINNNVLLQQRGGGGMHQQLMLTITPDEVSNIGIGQMHEPKK